MNDPRYTRAEQLQDTDPGEAVRLCLEVDPAHPNALNLAGFLLSTRLGAHDRGVTVLELARTADPTNAFVLPNLGMALVRAGRWTDARRLFEEALASALPGPVEQRASNWLGWQHLQRGEPEQALPLLERAVRLDARFALSQFNLAGALVALGRHTEALERIRWAFFGEGLHDVAGTLALRGEAYEGLGQLRRALGSFRRARAWAAAALDERASHFAVQASKLAARVRAAGLYIPAEADEVRWLDLEAAGGLRTIADGVNGAASARVEPLQSQGLRAWLEGPRLPAQLAGLPTSAAPADEASLRRWQELHLALYQRDLSREEPQPAPTPFEAQVLAHLSAGEHEEALRRLESEGVRQHPADLLPLLERERNHALMEGRRDDARRYAALALRGWRAWASEATSGAEGSERMAAVREAEARFAREAP